LIREVRVPKWGLTIESVTIVAWLHQPGSAVRVGEPLVEVETEKANAEVEAPCDGVLASVLAQAGDECDVGQVIATIEADE
jgi:pyruvate/2-oxoglutarate dehydrogenase complex dihydrolipoamide acyltransferase (E2) component